MNNPMQQLAQKMVTQVENHLMRHKRCKSCQIRPRQNGSSRCKECSKLKTNSK